MLQILELISAYNNKDIEDKKYINAFITGLRLRKKEEYKMLDFDNHARVRTNTNLMILTLVLEGSINIDKLKIFLYKSINKGILETKNIKVQPLKFAMDTLPLMQFKELVETDQPEIYVDIECFIIRG